MQNIINSERAERSLTASFLKAVPEFPTNAIRELEEAAVLRRYEVGDAIIEEGQPTGGIILLSKGTVQRWMSIPNSKSIVLPGVLAPAVLGVGSCMLGEPSALSAIALVPAETVFIPRANVLHVLRQFPDAGLAMSQLVSEELTHTYAHLTELRGCADARQRSHLVN